ncbi:DUF3106 domain-containing protein [Mycoavidus sp. B2-EB]|uniref:DUF3106 domain-containing protein n=1 Tax=Mycoavidus sp. B2-EB TaxID=2651972 RepID=UPI001E5FAE7F|nr:DUF3106 domain-containing protein [Mycoavidus sp. B2-EB]BBO59721.1 hypothetical protein MPB2EB_0846 [Mycoavidus sp. B2-EB]
MIGQRGYAILFLSLIATLLALSTTYPRWVHLLAHPDWTSAGQFRKSARSAEAEKRLSEQMNQWLEMTPEQRRIARENYQLSKSLPPKQRQNAWQAYQNLPAGQKEKLSAAARPHRHSTVVSAPPSGKTKIEGLQRIPRKRATKPALSRPNALHPASPDISIPLATPTDKANNMPPIFNEHAQ